MCLRVPKKAGSECGKRQAHASIGEKQGRATPGGGGGGATELAAVRSSAQDSMAEAELLVLHDDGHLARRGSQDDTTNCAQSFMSGESYPTFAPISWIFFAYCRNLGGNLL